MPKLSLDFPFGGLNENVSYSEQPPRTTADAKNCRGIDPVTGRVRGGQRPGTKRYTPDQLADTDATGSGEDHAVKDLNFVVANDKLNVYAELADGGGAPSGIHEEWTKDLEGTVWDTKTDSRGNIWGIKGDGSLITSSIFQHNSVGEELASVQVPLATSSAFRFVWDSAMNLYVGTYPTGTQDDARLTKFRINTDGTYTLAFSYAVKMQDPDGDETAPNTTAFPMAMYMKDDLLYVAVWDEASSEGEVHRYDTIANALSAPTAPDLAFAFKSAAPAYIDAWPLGMVVRGDGSIVIVGTEDGGSATTKDQWLVKYDTGGNHVLEEQSSVDTVGGIGGAIALDSNDNYYTVGAKKTGTGADNGWLVHWTDSGATLAETSGWPDDDANANWTSHVPFLSIAVDEDDNVYAPFPSSTDEQVRIFIPDSTERATYAEPNNSDVLSVAIPPTRPNYGDEDIDNGGGVTLQEFCYYGANEVSGDTLFKLRLVGITSSTGSQRTMTLAGVAKGAIFKFTSSASAAPNGSAALDTASDWVMSTAHFGKLYYVDGKNTVQYDPADKSTSANGEVSTLVSKTSGEVPQYCRLIASWRGRLVLARPADDGHNWFMSARDNPEDWDYFPSVVTPTIAVAGNQSDIGRAPDIINTLIPWSDDLLFFGCDHSIWRLTGDPMDGGQIDQVPTDYGMAFGQPWTEGPMGEIYFFGSRGGVHVMSASGDRERVSFHTIERRLTDVDLSTYHVRLVWDYRREGLHVFMMERGVLTGTISTGQATHYFWEQKTNSWWPDTFQLVAASGSAAALEPSAVTVIDGDAAADRRILIGRDDGRVAYFDDDAKNDETDETTEYSIDSYALLGPFFQKDAMRSSRFTNFQFDLAHNQDGVTCDLYSSDDAGLPGNPKSTFFLRGGSNPIVMDRVAGRNLWVKLSNGRKSSRWAYERGSATAHTAGRVRVG